MAFKINPEDFKKAEENAKKAFPKPFPEIRERMNLPTDKVVEIMQSHIERLFKNGGLSNVLEYRNELVTEREQVRARLDKDFSFDSKLYLEIVIDYYDMFIAQINAVKATLVRRGGEGNKHDGSSNADKLSIAEEWMTPLMDKITAFDVPKHEDVLNVFIQEYPGFDIRFDLNSLKTPYFAKGGRYIKKSIALAIIFIFEKKHPGKKVEEYTTITKRYDYLSW